MLRAETRTRARALQVLYAWDVGGRPAIEGVVAGCARLGRPWRAPEVEQLAEDVVAGVDDLDRSIAEVSAGWRMTRLGAVERNILRLALHELTGRDTPPKVVIDEAVRLAQWFAGSKAPAFVNGLLDALARRAGRL